MQAQPDNSPVIPNATPLETKEERGGSNLASILREVDVIFRQKFVCNGIELNGNLSAEDFFQLNAHIASKLTEWKATTFEEYKDYHEFSYFDKEEDNKDFDTLLYFLKKFKHYKKEMADEDMLELQEEFETFKKNLADFDALFAEYRRRATDVIRLSKLQNAFDQYIKGNGPAWSVKVNAHKETAHLIQFISSQLPLRRVICLQLEQALSSEAIDSILKACQNATIDDLTFSKNQTITEAQAKILIKCLNKEKIKWIRQLNGKDLSDETVEELMELGQQVYHCPHYDLRNQIQNNIAQAHKRKKTYKNPIKTLLNLNHSGSYRTDDIKKLTQKLVENLYPNIDVHLDNNFENPEWAKFFTILLSDPKIDLKKFSIANRVKFSAEVLQQLLTSLKLNTTLRKVSLTRHEESEMTQALQALTLHPSLIKLELSGNCQIQGALLKELLLHTKTLETLYLARAMKNENMVRGLAEGIMGNNTLERLYLAETRVSAEVLAQFKQALIENHSIVEMNLFLTAQARLNNEMYSIITRNKKLSIQNNAQQRQAYVEIVLLLSQAYRGSHPHFKSSFVIDSILSFLRPSSKVVSLEAVNRCTALIRSNINQRVWKPVLEVIEDSYYGKRINKFSIFKAWPRPSNVPSESKDALATPRESQQETRLNPTDDSYSTTRGMFARCAIS